jgi:Zn-dependent peptidase ImmA (M78 family)/transcriptional regulator with XRE-family HTH domain
MTLSPLNPEMLTLARDSRGRTQKEVADAAGVTQGLISKAEDGLVPIDPEKLRLIAEYLDYPEKLFLEPGHVREVGSACLYHRKRKTLPAKVLKKLDARMFMRNVNIRKLFDGLDVESDRLFHTLDIDEYGGSPVEVARALRAAWRVPDGPIPNLTRLIESAGGIILMEDFGHRKLFGMSCWTTRGHPFFFLNSAVPAAELRWTLAHELGHLTMHHIAPSGDPEIEADAFAGEFLAPEALFRPDCRRLTFDRLPNLKSYWRLSMKGIIKRAQTVGAIDQTTTVRLYKQHSARGYNTVEPYPVAPEPPTLIRSAIDVHLTDHEYTLNELATALLLNEAEFAHDLLGDAAAGRPANVVGLFDRPGVPRP